MATFASTAKYSSSRNKISRQLEKRNNLGREYSTTQKLNVIKATSTLDLRDYGVTFNDKVLIPLYMQVWTHTLPE